MERIISISMVTLLYCLCVAREGPTSDLQVSRLRESVSISVVTLSPLCEGCQNGGSRPLWLSIFQLNSLLLPPPPL